MPIFYSIATLLYLSLFIYAVLYLKPCSITLIFKLKLLMLIIWAVMHFPSFFLTNQSVVEFSNNTGSIAWVLFLAMMLHFVLLINKIIIKNKWLFLLLIYLPALFICSLIVTNKIEVYDLFSTKDISNLLSNQIFYIIYLLYIAVIVLISVSILYVNGLKSKNKELSYFSTVTIITGLICIALSAGLLVLLYSFGSFYFLIVNPFLFLLFMTGMAFSLRYFKKFNVKNFNNSEIIIDTVSDGVIITDNKFFIKKINKSFLKIIDNDIKTNIIDKHLNEIIENEIVNDLFLELSKAGKVSEKTVVITFYNNKKRTVLISGKIFIDDNNNKIGYIIFLKDITVLQKTQEELLKSKNELELKVLERTNELDGINSKLMTEVIERTNTEKRIRESEEMFRLLIEIAQDAIYIVDSEGVIKSVNQAMVDITGFEREEYIGKSFSDFMHPDELHYAWEIHNLIQKNIKPPIFELKYLHKSGVYNIAEFSTSPIVKNGVSIGTLGVGRDITNRKLIENKLIESEQKYRFIVENASEVIFSLSPDGKIDFITKNITPLLGYSVEEVIGVQFYNFIHPDDIEKALKNFKAVIDKEFEPIEFRIITKDRCIKHVKATGNIIQKDDVVLSLHGILNDITNLKLAEEKLKQMLEEKDILLKEVHHRVKNNLQVIISLLKLESYSTENDVVTKVFNSFVERLTSMKLVHEQLYMSESFKDISIKKYFNELLEHINTSFNSDGVSRIVLNSNIQNENLSLDTLIPLGLIVNELLSNSFKYAFPDKTGFINVEFLKRSESNYYLCIADDGVGFDKEIMNNGGKTLGLKLINALVNQIEGTILVNTERGSKFEISFIDRSKLN